MELLDKFGDSGEAEERIAKEMGWDRKFTSEEEAERRESVEETNATTETDGRVSQALEKRGGVNNWRRN